MNTTELVEIPAFTSNNNRKVFLRERFKSQAHTSTGSSANVPVKGSKVALVKGALFEWSLTADINCYTKIFETKSKLGQLFWLGVLLIFIGFTSLLIISSVANYYNYEVVTSIKVITQIPAELPALTICSAEPFLFQDSEFILEEVANQTGYLPSHNIVEYLAKFKMSEASYEEEKRKHVGLINVGVLRSDLLRKRYMFDYGNCFEFNTGVNATHHKVDILRSDEPGSDEALLWFYSNDFDSFRNKYTVYSSVGLKVGIQLSKSKLRIFT